MKFDNPFPHSVIDNFLTPEQVRSINAQWPADTWTKEDGKFNRKWSTPILPPAAKEAAYSIDIGMVEEATGIGGLFRDPQLFGAGLHCIPAGGFLKMHVDFNVHPKGWLRRVNLLIYLNESWEDAWGGHLQLGMDRPKRIAPIGGRCVIFETNENSWHGHPDPLACPDNVQRRSLALYFYTRGKAKDAHTTIYQKKAKR